MSRKSQDSACQEIEMKVPRNHSEESIVLQVGPVYKPVDEDVAELARDLSFKFSVTSSKEGPVNSARAAS